MNAYEIPLSPKAQQFQIQLANVAYIAKVAWNSVAGLWMLDLLDTDSVPVVTSLPLQPGADLLSQFKHLALGGELWVQLDGNLNQAPGFDDLGSSGHLYFVTT